MEKPLPQTRLTGVDLCFLTTGKNDGSIGGHRYFHCKPGYGVLVRPDRLSSRDRTSGRTGECAPAAHVPVLRGEAIVGRRGENRKSWSSWNRESRTWMGEMNSPQPPFLFSSQLCHRPTHLNWLIAHPPIAGVYTYYVHSLGKWME